MTTSDATKSLLSRFPSLSDSVILFPRVAHEDYVFLNGCFTMEELIHIGMLLSILNECNKKEEA